MAEIKTQDLIVEQGDRRVFTTVDATIIFDCIAQDAGTLRCLGSPEHFREDGGCDHLDLALSLNPTINLGVVPKGGADCEVERRADLEWRAEYDWATGEPLA